MKPKTLLLILSTLILIHPVQSQDSEQDLGQPSLGLMRAIELATKYSGEKGILKSHYFKSASLIPDYEDDTKLQWILYLGEISGATPLKGLIGLHVDMDGKVTERRLVLRPRNQ